MTESTKSLGRYALYKDSVDSVVIPEGLINDQIDEVALQVGAV